MKSEVLEISSWKSVKQFEAMKDCLQTGLQEHIKYNNVLRAMLDLPETLEDRKVDRVRCRELLQWFSCNFGLLRSCFDDCVCCVNRAISSTRSLLRGSNAAMNSRETVNGSSICRMPFIMMVFTSNTSTELPQF